MLASHLLAGLPFNFFNVKKLRGHVSNLLLHLFNELLEKFDFDVLFF